MPKLNPPIINGVSANKLIVTERTHATCLDFLCTKLPKLSREEWLARIHAGLVLDEQSQPITAQTIATRDKCLYYYRHIPDEIPNPFQETILYQDEWLVVADKPHFLPVAPSGRYVQETLLVRLRKKLGIDTLIPVHRIDRETAGIVLFSVNKASRDPYQRMFRENNVYKHYDALAPKLASLHTPLRYKSKIIQSDNFMQMSIVDGTPNAETLITLTESNETLGKYKLEPITGKKHQLRVQLCQLGIPIINDRIYPNHLPESTTQAMLEEEYQHPLQLVAKTISFIDPITHEYREFTSHYDVNL